MPVEPWERFQLNRRLSRLKIIAASVIKTLYAARRPQFDQGARVRYQGATAVVEFLDFGPIDRNRTVIWNDGAWLEWNDQDEFSRVPGWVGAAAAKSDNKGGD